MFSVPILILAAWIVFLTALVVREWRRRKQPARSIRITMSPLGRLGVELDRIGEEFEWPSQLR